MSDAWKPAIKQGDGICPNCGDEDLETISNGHGEEGGFAVDWHCNRCGSHGEAHYEIKFVCHSWDRDKDREAELEDEDHE